MESTKKVLYHLFLIVCYTSVILVTFTIHLMTMSIYIHFFQENQFNIYGRILHAHLQCNLAIPLSRDGVYLSNRGSGWVLWLLWTTEPSRSEAVPVPNAAVNWASIFCFLLLEASCHVKNVPAFIGNHTLERPKVQAEVLEDEMPSGYRERPRSNKVKTC